MSNFGNMLINPKSKIRYPLSIIAVFILFSGCFGINKNQEQAQREAGILLENTENSLFWGDTHLHTANSPDAYAVGNRLGFEEAYRFAKGEVIEVDGQKVQLETPLDFLVVADHAEGFGIVNELKNGNPVLMKDTLFQRWNRLLNGTKRDSEIVGKEMPDALDKGILPPSAKDTKIIGPITKSIWNGYLDIADRYNEAGKFTAMNIRKMPPQ